MHRRPVSAMMFFPGESQAAPILKFPSISAPDSLSGMTKNGIRASHADGIRVVTVDAEYQHNSARRSLTVVTGSVKGRLYYALS